MESVYQNVPKRMFKHAILAGSCMLIMSRETINILICHVSTLITHYPLNNKTVASCNSVHRSLSQHIVNSQHVNVCTLLTVMILPAVANTVHVCCFMFSSAASGREREKESDSP